MMTKAILVVSFGTTFPDTRVKTIEACEKAIQYRYPEYAVYRAFTSNVVIRRIKAKEGIDIPTVAQALQQMKDVGVREVYVQPLHVILGGEYDKIIHQVKAFQDDFEVLKVAQPLLASSEDYQAVSEILLDKYGHFGEDAACVLMGHGSQHYAFVAYSAMDHMLMNTPVYIGCVESYPPVESIEKRLRARGIKHVHLAPFMLVAGDHATNDMVSDDDDSWNTFFRQNGYEVTPHLVGLGEYPEIQDLYLTHLAAIMD